MSLSRQASAVNMTPLFCSMCVVVDIKYTIENVSIYDIGFIAEIKPTHRFSNVRVDSMTLSSFVQFHPMELDFVKYSHPIGAVNRRYYRNGIY